MRRIVKNGYHLATALVWSACALPGSAVERRLLNPVARCADAGILKHRGEYIMSGVGLPGQALVSTDLVHWRGPYRIFEPRNEWDSRPGVDVGAREVHAPCFAYIDGVFHLYWNGIGHAVSRHLLGPYAEPDTTHPFDAEIDPFLFADEDGSLFFYTVKFDQGNVIWGQPMTSPDHLTGDATELLRVTPGTWENRHGRIAEGPEVIRYRDRYYLFYAANHTSIAYGHYAIGCASTDTPLGFGEKGKARFPVLERNEQTMEDDANVLLHTGPRGGPVWRYTTTAPASDWAQPDVPVPASWSSGQGGFGWPVRPESQIHDVAAVWTSNDLWLRCTIMLEHSPSPFLKLKVRHVLGAEIFFNGVRVHESALWVGPRLLDLAPEAIAALRPGANVIAAHVSSPEGNPRFFDMALIDPGDHHPDDLIWNMGQPNLLRGPNGFEWILAYFAMWNEGPHSQGVNRVHFFGHRVHVDGPSGGHPSQYQPQPYGPTFGDRFETGEAGPTSGLDEGKWEIDGGSWTVEEGEVRVTDGRALADSPARVSHAFPRVGPAASYLFEVAARSLPNNTAPYGIVAWQVDPENSVSITLDPTTRAWTWQRLTDGVVTSGSLPLPNAFDVEAYHMLRLENNSGLMTLWIDHLRVTPPRAAPWGTLAEAGRPGLLSKGAQMAFDAVLYTAGWDEFGRTISGWRRLPKPMEERTSDLADQVPATASGLLLNGTRAPRTVAKDAPGETYEFSAQLTAEAPENEELRGRMSVYPMYVDRNTFLKAEFDLTHQQLVVNGKRDGRPLGPLSVDLGGSQRASVRSYGPSRETDLKVLASHCFEHDSIEAVCDGRIPRSSQENLPKLTFWPHKGTAEWLEYRFATPRAVSGSEIIWYDDRRTGGGCRVPASWRLLARVDDIWKPVDLVAGSEYGTEMDVLNVVRFRPVHTNGLRLEVIQQPDQGSGLYEWALLDEFGRPQPEKLDLHLQQPAFVDGVTMRFADGPSWCAPMAVDIDMPAGRKWASLTSERHGTQDAALWHVSFPAVETDQVQLTLYRTPATAMRLIEAHTDLAGQRSYNLRAIHTGKRVVLMVDGIQRVELPGGWPTAQVALEAVGTAARIDGITCFRIEPE